MIECSIEFDAPQIAVEIRFDAGATLQVAQPKHENLLLISNAIRGERGKKGDLGALRRHEYNLSQIDLAGLLVGHLPIPADCDAEAAAVALLFWDTRLLSKRDYTVDFAAGFFVVAGLYEAYEIDPETYYELVY